METARQVAFMVRVEPEHNCHRFYNIWLHQELFDCAWSVVFEWGRLGSPGRVFCRSFSSEAQAMHKLGEMTKAKKRRGYRFVDES